ncbi:Alpha/Beta hydrolase protein [Xylariomycetidae sp. FL0641]|nr:Alpha/Beta hydrolase protein [Xylariomycetidae sp. FL0641]
MRWTSVISGLSAVAVVAEARSWQHVGKKAQQPKRRTAPIEGLNRYAESPDTSNYKFANNNTAKFSVNGTGIPDVDFDIGESYAGYLPLANSDDGELFFWFFPTSNSSSEEKEILLWLNGGPGCSSLEGLIQENGPFIWQYGTYKPVPNPWSWNRLTNVVYVEQPVGTGFSRGKVTAKNEKDVAEQFNGFWKNFMDTFSMQGWKVYIAGESYAGMYVPYLAEAMLDRNDTTYYDVQGALIYDPVIGDDAVQGPVVTVPYVDYFGSIMPFNDSFSEHIHTLHQDCGFADYMDKYLVYPPSGPQPADYAAGLSDECVGIQNLVMDEAMSINPCFDVYQIATTCPLLYDVLGFPGSLFYSPAGSGPVYFDRADVKAAIHVDTDYTWEECASHAVFVDDADLSPPSAWAALPRVIDATQNVILGHGELDILLIANGSLLAIQNMTWGGQLGFSSPPTNPFFVPFHADSTPAELYAEADMTTLATVAAAGVLGSFVSERGFTYVGVNLSGHMIPQYAPSAAFRQLELLLGRVAALDSTAPFSTDKTYPQPAAADLGDGTAAPGFAQAEGKSGGGADTVPTGSAVKAASRAGLAAGAGAAAAAVWVL